MLSCQKKFAPTTLGSFVYRCCCCCAWPPVPPFVPVAWKLSAFCHGPGRCGPFGWSSVRLRLPWRTEPNCGEISRGCWTSPDQPGSWHQKWQTSPVQSTMALVGKSYRKRIRPCTEACQFVMQLHMKQRHGMDLKPGYCTDTKGTHGDWTSPVGVRLYI